MIASFIEFVRMLVKEKYMTPNTAFLLFVVVISLFVWRNVGQHTSGLDQINHHLSRMEEHMDNEDHNVDLIIQCLDDHQIHVNKTESPKERDREEDDDSISAGSNNLVWITTRTNYPTDP